MSSDRSLELIETVYACISDKDRWQDVLTTVADEFGVCALIETVDRATGVHTVFGSSRLPPASEIQYLEDYAHHSPRLSHGLSQELGAIGYDYQILTEQEMARNLFYSEFLPQMGLRYFMSGILHQDETRFSAFSVQRSELQGHVEKSDLDRLKSLLPHIRQAFDLTLRLERSCETEAALTAACDWLSDATILIRADGTIVFANDPARDLLRAGDGIRTVSGELSFTHPQSQMSYLAALAAVLKRPQKDTNAVRFDFAANRPTGAEPLVVAVRRLPAARHGLSTSAMAAVFVRRPEASSDGVDVMRTCFGLTVAEAELAEALRTGISVSAYGSLRGLSVNTVYTHLRRVKDKTGTSRLPDLVRKLNRVVMDLRPQTPH